MAAKKGGSPTKSEVLTLISKDTGLSRKQVAGVFDSLGGVIKKSLRGNGLFTFPGLLKMKVVKKDSGLRASYGTMVLRELVGKWLLVNVLIGSLCFIATIVLDFMLVWDQDRQELWDKIAGTIVVDDPDNALSKDSPSG